MPEDKENQDGVDQNPDQSPDGAAPAPAAKAFYEEFDGDLRSNPSITKFKSPADLAKSYVELQKALGKEKVVIPTEKSTQEEWDAFFKKIGKPEKDDEYDASEDDLPEQVRSRAEALAEFRKQAHAAGVTKKQFDVMFKSYKKAVNDRVNQTAEEIKGLRGKSETELRSEWGAAYEGKIAAAQNVINAFFKDKGIRPEFSILANDKGFIKAMSEIAEKVGEDVIAGKPRTTKTPAEAAKEYNEILRSDKKHPYFNELDPEHDQMVDYVLGLQELMMSGGSV